MLFRIIADGKAAISVALTVHTQCTYSARIMHVTVHVQCTASFLWEGVYFALNKKNLIALEYIHLAA